MNKQILVRYLRKREYSPQTIQQVLRSIDQFQSWLDMERLLLENVSKPIVMYYIDYAQTTLKYAPLTINQKLAHLKLYYQLLGMHKNPFSHLKVRGQRKRIYPMHLTSDKLQGMYLELPETSREERRAKIYAGFYLFQGVATRDAKVLTLESVDMERAELRIPRSRRANERVLPLHPLQMKLLFACVEKRTNNLHFNLFKILGKATDDRWVIKHMRIQLANSKEFISLTHIRYSVIRNWHKTNNLRQVQYNAGHRYISTTEKLLRSNYEQLRSAILEKHPLQ